MALLQMAASSAGALDLSQAVVSRLDNGLTLVVLEDHTLPVVSVQMVYKVGARHEEMGRTGLAHFLEHMAFRATQNFPDTEVVSAIYAVGGEWHGYTWLDQTTYFETLPAEHLDLALRIEADRMDRLLLPADEVEAERGAVLSEMHGYENDPATVLKDAVLQVSFLQHPYRNNSIGWESDVASIQHEDIASFYRRHYRPANAVLAVVGDVSRSKVTVRVEELFGALSGGEPSAPPPTVEPPQQGVRRVELQGSGSRQRFEIAYRAPGVTSPDYAAFLLLQEVLGGGSGINFAQNEWGDPVEPDSRLAGIAEDLVTWYPPQAAPYVFTIAGSAEPTAASEEIESRIETAIGALRETPPAEDELYRARRSLRRELIFDVETTEDAAHQLAFFVGLDALPVLLRLPDLLDRVTAGDVRRVARVYLQPYQRTIGWYRVGAPLPTPSPPADSSRALEEPRTPVETPRGLPSTPRALRLSSGMPVLFQRLPLSPASYLRVLVPTVGLETAAAATPDAPVWRHTSLNYRFLSEELEATLRRARVDLATAVPAAPSTPAGIEDPGSRLALAFDELLGIEAPSVRGGAAAIALVGDLAAKEALPLLEKTFGDLPPQTPSFSPLELQKKELRVELGVARAQAQLGYVTVAPPPGEPDWLAWRILLYILSHGYEGRLGKEAIARRGLVYYIDARYLTDGANGRVSLEIDVDPPKLGAMKQLLVDMLEDLRVNPPTAVELDEAGRHLLGRRTSVAQSNEEVTAALLAEWAAHGRLLSNEEFVAAVQRIDLDDLRRVLPDFLGGAVVEVRVGGDDGSVTRAGT